MGTSGVKMAVFLLTSGIVTTYAAPMAAPEFVPDCTGLHGTDNYPNLQQLNTYYQCVHGTPILQYCPSRQEFNAAKGKCEALRSMESYADVDTSGIKCLFEGEYVCNPLNPKSFYQCSFGKPHLHDCPAGLNFNTNLKVCDYSGPVEACGLQGVCKYEGQYLSNPDNPKSFYQCSHGIAILHNCPSGLTFNINLNVCDYPKALETDGPQRFINGKEEKDPCEGIEDEAGLYPHVATNCEYYFRCDNHRRDGDLLKCEEGKRFSSHTLECDLPSNICAPCGTKQC